MTRLIAGFLVVTCLALFQFGCSSWRWGMGGLNESVETNYEPIESHNHSIGSFFEVGDKDDDDGDEGTSVWTIIFGVAGGIGLVILVSYLVSEA